MAVDERERQLITRAIETLSEPEKLVMAGVYYEHLALEELAAAFEVSLARVDILHRRALAGVTWALEEAPLANADGAAGPEAPDWKLIGKAFKGSQRRIQEWVEYQPELLEQQLRQSRSLDKFMTGSPEWLSPLRPSLYRELRDDLWRVAGLSGKTPQQDGFWPPKGPAWDAVGLLPGRNQTGVLLVEAKSHGKELDDGSPCGANPWSRRKIEGSLSEVQGELGGQPGISWADTTYYQMANRLAFLWYMREQRGIPTWMLWIYFVGDRFESGGREIVGPTDIEGWAPRVDNAYDALGLPEAHKLSDYAPTIFAKAEPVERRQT